ncbi:hypothetical protein GCM10012286_62880 [Streptomyces lasiicapitis]|uniref:Transposase IS701-like DDE domain-containing protein n=1 Tax=Streptomyces lasiicapitis TaxID=1923961 RepID=A0ABQ2MPT0_9ACTN|nr:hypothetical protein GCM10012286_62880 [Streptomyces lasiicapitis]
MVEYLRDPDAVLVVDETGDLKEGTATVGVQRQYTGTAGRVENAQVAVYLVTPPPADTPPSTEPCMCRTRGPRHRTAAGARASPTALTEARLFGATPPKANLAGAGPPETHLAGATLPRARLHQVDLSNTRGLMPGQAAPAALWFCFGRPR